MASDFAPDQKRYLEGFVAGAEAMRGARPSAPTVAPSPPTGPDAAHIAAQDALTASGKKLADQEKWKRAEHPFDAYPTTQGAGAGGRFPEAGRQLPLALFRPLLCRAGAGELHAEAAHPQRHTYATRSSTAWPTSPSVTAAATPM